MTAGIASLVFIPILSVAFAHFLWAFGGTWPMQSREMLAKTVIGTTGVTHMPPRYLTFLFAIATLAAGIVALALSDPGAGMTVTGIGALLAIGLLARGVAGYTPRWRAWRPEQPFAAMDKKYYSPLALYLGAGFAFLVIWRFM